MTTILIINSADEEPTVREMLSSVVEAGETVYFLRLPAVRCLGQLIQEITPMLEYDIDYTIHGLPGENKVSELVEFAIEADADRICIGISERTPTGKARIDDLTESILLHDHISGDFVVGDHVIVLEELEYEM